MRIVLSELSPELGAIERNLDRIEEVLAARPCELAVFPELFLTGYRVGDLFHRIAIVPGGAEERRLGEIARTRHAAIAVGAPVRSVERPGEVHNAVLLATPDGLLRSQVKRFLPTFGPFEEGVIFSPTDTSRPVRMGPTMVGLEICYDAFFPEVSRDLAVAGAELLVIVSAGPITSRSLFEKVLPARAVENACPLVYVNRVGVEDGLVFGGGSVALDARGERVEEEPFTIPSLSKGERLFAVEIDVAGGARWRPFRPVLRDISSRPGMSREPPAAPGSGDRSPSAATRPPPL
jgi:predicted amidohydrolase